MGKTKKSIVFFTFILALSLIGADGLLYAGEHIDLTLDSAVDIAMKNSYRIQQLEMGIERTRYFLQARRASLKSSVYMNLQVPDINSTSEFKWNSTLQKDEIVRENTSRVQMDLSIRQPVILLGYPTNGYLSLNNQMYQYEQRDNGDTDTTYYNRYFVRFTQPFFQPNTLKNNIEEAELDLEDQELDYIDDLVRLIDDIADDYYELFELSYENVVISHHVDNLQKVFEIVTDTAERDSSRAIEALQTQVELANTRERLLENQSDMRLDLARMKQRLRLNDDDSLSVAPVVSITPVTVGILQALDYGYNLRPRMKTLAIQQRRNELNLEGTKGRDSFRVDLEMTYGLEKKDEDYEMLWDEQDNSYSVAVNAYVPIWDWGERRARIEADKLRIEQTKLSIEETRNSIKSEINNAVANLEEYQRRAINMQGNMKIAMDLTEMSIQSFENESISVQDILQIIERQNETELNFLDAYLGYRQSLLRLMVNTHYDYEKDMPLIDIFRAKQNDTDSENSISLNFSPNAKRTGFENSFGTIQ